MVYEIKSAVILAAGRGIRLASMTDARPKPLLEVRGQVLIERLIKQLQAKGIDDIYIVTGYKHWMFDYLKEKYDVTLVYNKKWFCTNNIVSFIKAFEERSDFINRFGTIMLDADLYIEDESIIKTKIDNSGYYLEYSDNIEFCSNEWVAELVGEMTHRIGRVITTGSRCKGFVLRSLSYWTPVDFEKLYKFAKEAIKDGQNMQRYIDDISCILYKDEFNLRGYTVNKSALLEIDTTHDYKIANMEKVDEKD